MGAWSLEAYIKPAENEARNRLGSSVALSGDTLVVGAPGRNNQRGGAFVFRRAADGSWSQEAALEFSGELEVEDNAGETVAVSGDWVAVGAPHRRAESDTAANPGAVHLFRRSGGVWSRAVELIPPVDFQRGERFDHYQFGNAVAMDGDLLAVGARGDSSSALGVGGDPHNEDRFRSGAVYVYRREGASWVFEAYLKADLEGPGERFGHRLALDGESLLITAPRSRNLATEGTGGVGAMLNDSGLVFLFQRVDGEWGQVVRLKASNASIDDQFGVWAALEDGILTVGAAYEDGGGPLFGGDPTEEDVGQSGAVYVFAELPGVGWRQVLYIKAPVVDPDDQFGFSLALSGGRLAVGAPNEGSAVVEDSMDNTHEAAGAVWVYDFTRATDGEVCDGFDNDRDDSVDETFSECSSACVNGLCR